MRKTVTSSGRKELNYSLLGQIDDQLHGKVCAKYTEQKMNCGSAHSGCSVSLSPINEEWVGCRETRFESMRPTESPSAPHSMGVRSHPPEASRHLHRLFLSALFAMPG